MRRFFKRFQRRKNEIIAVLAGAAAVSVLALSGCGEQERAVLKIYVDGSVVGDTGLLAEQFHLRYPEIGLDFEVLPQVRHDSVITEEGISTTVDSDSLAARTAALQRQRTAIMAGSSDGDLFLVGGGLSQYDEYNGGALLDDPRLLTGNGALADVSAIFEGKGALDRKAYIGPAFSAGSGKDALYLVPLGIGVSCGVIADADAPAVQALGEAGNMTDFFSVLTQQYPEELGNLSASWNLPFLALSHPAVDKLSRTLYAEDASYREAFDVCEELLAADAAEKEEGNGSALLMQSCHPYALGAAAQEAAGNGEKEAVILPVPDEEGGITAFVEFYAFAPASSDNVEAAVTFLRWMLGVEVQSLGTGSENAAMLNTATFFPVRKDCLRTALAQHLGERAESLGEALPESLATLGERITAVRYANRYDYELFEALRQCKENPDTTVDEVMEPLLAEWRLYLDE